MAIATLALLATGGAVIGFLLSLLVVMLLALGSLGPYLRRRQFSPRLPCRWSGGGSRSARIPRTLPLERPLRQQANHQLGSGEHQRAGAEMTADHAAVGRGTSWPRLPPRSVAEPAIGCRCPRTLQQLLRHHQGIHQPNRWWWSASRRVPAF
jgi:hypothetical protein